QTAHRDRSGLADVLLKTLATDDREVARRRRTDVVLAPTVRQVHDLFHLPGASQLLLGGQGDACRVDAGLVEEGLVPRNERRRLPAAIVVDGEHGPPVRERGCAVPLPP